MTKIAVPMTTGAVELNDGDLFYIVDFHRMPWVGPGPEVSKKIFMLNSIKHDFFPAQKC